MTLIYCVPKVLNDICQEKWLQHVKKTAFLNFSPAGTDYPELIKRLAAGLFPVAVLLAGLGIGSWIGAHMITSLITGNGRLGLLLYKPSFEHLVTVSLLNSDNELKRIEGYYALRDSGKIEINYLTERYKAEEALYIRRTIIWLMGYSGDHRFAVKALSSLYADAAHPLKIEILRSLAKIDANLLDTFIKEHKVTKDITDAL